MKSLTDPGKVTLQNGSAPELDSNMLMGDRSRLSLDGQWRAVEIVAQRQTGQFKERWNQVDVRRDAILSLSLGNARAANKKRDSDVFFETSGFARGHTVLTDMESVVRSVDDVGVVDLATFFKTRYQFFDQFVNSLQGTQSLAIVMILVVNDGLVLQRKVGYPAHSGALKWSVSPFLGSESVYLR